MCWRWFCGSVVAADRQAAQASGSSATGASRRIQRPTRVQPLPAPADGAGLSGVPAYGQLLRPPNRVPAVDAGSTSCQECQAPHLLQVGISSCSANRRENPERPAWFQQRVVPRSCASLCAVGRATTAGAQSRHLYQSLRSYFTQHRHVGFHLFAQCTEAAAAAVAAGGQQTCPCQQCRYQRYHPERPRSKYL